MNTIEKTGWIRATSKASGLIVIGRVLNSTNDEYLMVRTESGFEYEIRVNSENVELVYISEQKYFHDVLRYPSGINL
jgi:hypothetical protein